VRWPVAKGDPLFARLINNDRFEGVVSINIETRSPFTVTLAQHQLNCLPRDDLEGRLRRTFPLNRIDCLGRYHGFSEEFNRNADPSVSPAVPRDITRAIFAQT
jgi:hypothetical protein